MRKPILAWITISVLGLAACQTPTPIPQAAQPTPAEIVPVSQEIDAPKNYCLSCHSDNEQLIAMAKPEEEVEAESSGAG